MLTHSRASIFLVSFLNFTFWPLTLSFGSFVTTFSITALILQLVSRTHLYNQDHGVNDKYQTLI